MCFFCRLKEGVDFHLFITTSPCGDARIFSLHEAPSTREKEAKEKEAKEKEDEEPKGEVVESGDASEAADTIKDDITEAETATVGGESVASDTSAEAAAAAGTEAAVEESFVSVWGDSFTSQPAAAAALDGQDAEAAAEAPVPNADDVATTPPAESCALVDENNNLADSPSDSKEELPQVDENAGAAEETAIIIKDGEDTEEKDDEETQVKVREMTSKQVLDEIVELDENGNARLPPNIVVPEIRIELVDDNGDPIKDRRADSSR